MSVAVVQNLTVRYGQFTALDNLSVEIPAGCTGLLGPNGAGKTTLIKTFLGFVKPTDGTGHVLGLDIRSQGREIRQAVGLMPEQDCHLPGMSAVQFVSYAGELAGMPHAQAIRRAHEVLEYCGLGEARYRNVETYSTGMKQRIKLAQALVHGPRLLLLDEPTNGLDPNGRVEMLELIRSVSHGKGVNVIVSSHLLPDIEQVCDEVVVVVGGKLRDSGKIADLKRIAGQPVDVELRDPSAFFVEMAGAAGFKLLGARHSTYRFQPPADTPDALHKLYQVAEQTGTQIRGFAIAQRSLEEAFLEAVNR